MRGAGSKLWGTDLFGKKPTGKKPGRPSLIDKITE